MWIKLQKTPCIFDKKSINNEKKKDCIEMPPLIILQWTPEGISEGKSIQEEEKMGKEKNVRDERWKREGRP